MKKWLILSGILILLGIAGFFALSYYGVTLIQKRLEGATGPGLTLQAIKVRPTHLAVRGIRYEDPETKTRMLEIEEIRIYPDIFSPLKGSFKIRACTVSKPFVLIRRSPEGNFSGPWIDLERPRKEQEVRERKDVKEPDGPASFQVRIERFQIENGAIDFEDEKTGGPAAKISLRSVALEVKEIQFPMNSHRSPLDFEAKLAGAAKEGEIRAKGWIDLKTLDTETSLDVRDLEVRTFEPYYRKKVTAEIRSGTVAMETRIVIQKRKIDAPGKLIMADLQLGKSEGMVFYIPAKVLVDLLKDRGNRIQTQFRVTGNLDDPKFNLQDSFLNRVAFSLGESLGLPIKTIGETMVGGSVKGAEGFSEGIKSIGDLFKKKKKESAR